MDRLPMGVAAIAAAITMFGATTVSADSLFRIGIDEATGGIASLRQAGDRVDTEYIQPGKALGVVLPVPGADVASEFAEEGETLVWSLKIRNRTDRALEVGDLGLPLPFNTHYAKDPVETYTKRVFRHHFIAGPASWIYWTRPTGAGPYLVMTPLPGTGLEYYDVDQSKEVGGQWEGPFTVWIHSAARAGRETRGSWRLPHTSVTLAPAGTPGDEVSYGFRFRWAGDLAGVRGILYDEGLFDIHIVPGMVVPVDLFALVALRTRNAIESAAAEFPDATRIEDLGVRGENARNDGTRIFRVRFSRLGENLLTFRYGGGRTLSLEFFATPPIESLIRKRAAFIVEKQQHRDPSKWYDGLFSLWDMGEGKLLSPDDTGGLHPYMVGGSDDPCLGKGPYVAAKNLIFPDRAEVAAVEYYIDRFVWGKLQRTDEETPHPYGIYGSDNWYVNRRSPIGLGSGGHGRERMWRTFDYPHLILLYFDLYRLARDHPGLTRSRDARAYLARAAGTARAFFTVPSSIRMGEPWTFRGFCDWAYKQGNFHERVLVDLIDALDREGLRAEADWLRGEWEKKVRYFIRDDPYPFASEMYFDSTGFESSHAIAAYALAHATVGRDEAKAFLDRQIAANIACRGWLETAYSLLGSDFRSCGTSSYLLSYMSQMGGWAILDHALHHAEDPAPFLRLGYASILSSWALVRADGAAAWAFEPKKYGRAWSGVRQGRGPWRHDGEIDHGFIGGLDAAATIVADDPIFGRIAYGGILREAGDAIAVVPRDGVRRRLHILAGGLRLHLALERDGFAREAPIAVDPAGVRIRFTLENRGLAPHATRIRCAGLPPGRYAVEAGGAPVAAFAAEPGRDASVHVPVGSDPAYEMAIRQEKR
ncbi:MAG: hypothetical protein JXP34_09405 [Planctomycetes bacterium]|nr:hypothetical protein [Planctomycetota bacterium]